MAGKQKYQPKKSINNHFAVLREKSLIQKHYDFIRCEIMNGMLYCYGHYKPAEDCTEYKYRIKYVPGKTPKVNVVSPEIKYNDDIHMYPADNTLCLYHKTDLIWDINCNLYNTVIPWTHEWFVYYELYKINGTWLHPFVPHKGAKTEE